jgi:hypothetical protein
MTGMMVDAFETGQDSTDVDDEEPFHPINERNVALPVAGGTQKSSMINGGRIGLTWTVGCSTRSRCSVHALLTEVVIET